MLRKSLLTSALGMAAIGATWAHPANRLAGTSEAIALAGGTVSGRVVDARGEGIPGVTVIVEGTTLGASTNADGTYTIGNVPAGSYTLVYSFVGLNSARVPVTVTEGQTTQLSTTRLSDNTTALSEAVVVGYGTARRQDVTGAVTTVTTKDFVQGQVTSPEQLVQGKVAGVQITTGGGAPGEVSTIRIRGGSSLNASNDPLIVIDGVPVDNQGISGAGNALALVNPQDIETFTVLKDASATAIYGSRAANGVILITTKKGLEGEKMRVNVSSQVSRATNYGKVDVLSADAYRTLLNNAVAQGTIPSSNTAFLGTANTDWQDAIYKTAWTTDNTVSLTGSVKHMPYRVSVGYLDQDGTLRTGNLKRNSASVGLSPRLFDNHLRIDVNAKGSWADYRFADQGAIGAAIRYNPTQPIYNNGPTGFNGYQEWRDGAIPNPLTDRNPVALLNDKRDRSTVLRSIGNVQFDYKLHFLPDLHANLNLGYDISRSAGTVAIAAASPIAYSTQGLNNNYRQEKNNKLLEAYLNYTKQLGLHRVEALAGYSYQDFYTYSPFRFSYKADGSRINPLEPAQFPFKTQYTLLSYYGRVNYNYDDRYLVTGTLRADGSSHFSPENRWGYFPAASVAWRINKEAFMADAAVVSDLKLRLSYGSTGQQDITSVAGDYPYLAKYSLSSPTVSQIIGRDTIRTLKPAAYDRNLKWEQTDTYDAGIDFGFFNNRFTGSVDVYLRKTRDLLAVIPVPAGSNLSNTLLTNIGNLENRGVELALNYNVLQGQRLNWSVNFNATVNRGKITKLTQVEDPNYLGTPTGNVGNFQFVQVNAVGYAPNTFFLYQQKYEGGKPLQGPTASASVAQYVDQNGDGLINERDKVYGKNPAPKAILGFSSNMSYGKASLAFTVRSNIGGYVYNNVTAGQNNYYFLNTTLGYAGNVVPAIYNTGFKSGQPFSDINLEDGTFVRLQNVTLGYDFGSLLKEGTTLRLTLAGQNLLLLSKYSGLDPERATGIDSNFYPLPRTVTAGLNIGF
ncbi:SusC/RagA family TonB-linked outer membrane protein [Hymenobacter sp. DH14]|uniref:SusC/RagA family TonB-linked outer membrane protein n=1 Tax=Hymenobacter cyanobacteriorum TaxID=2926463 RepID=A0A9X2AKM8_9BACT|nr:SusC/RagA family TonB-linked outer membrane protein [Hymenobacter cyanobacteriorum]MCI1189999.1 SusC/RagA family TonB-linked outer membrane protein [Hymenobacter cyanobacteriorum]